MVQPAARLDDKFSVLNTNTWRFVATFSGFVQKSHAGRALENGATQAGTRHPSPQEIKVNNRDLASCSRNLIIL